GFGPEDSRFEPWPRNPVTQPGGPSAVTESGCADDRHTGGGRTEAIRTRPLSAVVLAAGEGTRMRSARPKPLHMLCGRPMVLPVVDALAELEVERVVLVVGHSAERVTKTLLEQGPPHLKLDFVEQRVQRGTGDAVSVALLGFRDEEVEDGDVVVLPGDTPLLRPPTLAALVRAHREADAAASILTAVLPQPYGYGRVVRDKNDRVSAIVEEADASPEERAIEEVNTSIYCFRHGVLAPALRRLNPDNAQREYYLTDIVAVLHDAGYNVISQVVDDPMEAPAGTTGGRLPAAGPDWGAVPTGPWCRAGAPCPAPERPTAAAPA